MRVLVVEDEPKMANVIRRSLTKEGLAADVATRGEEGLWMAQATPYDAIVLDVTLPTSRVSSCAGNCASARSGRRC